MFIWWFEREDKGCILMERKNSCNTKSLPITHSLSQSYFYPGSTIFREQNVNETSIIAFWSLNIAHFPVLLVFGLFSALLLFAYYDVVIPYYPNSTWKNFLKLLELVTWEDFNSIRWIPCKICIPIKNKVTFSHIS